MLRTVSVLLGTEDYFVEIFSRMRFYEVSRTTTGGVMSKEKVQMTFKGGEDSFFNHNGFVKVPAEDFKGEKTGEWMYYSIRFPEGILCKTHEDYQKAFKKKDENFQYGTL